jgi:TfoX/Sxy family transcriptional regulator of competence genes
LIRRCHIDDGAKGRSNDLEERSRYGPVVAYDEDLADRMRAQLSGERVAEKKMFGGLAFLIGGNMAVAASGQGGLMVRVDPADTEALLAEPGAAEFEMRGRGPMKGWLRVSADAVADEDTLAVWVRRGVTYAKSLPPK